MIRAGNALDPEGSSDETDNEAWHFEASLGALVVPQLGFAIKVKEEDWDKLALNTYVENTGTHVIPFEIMFDLGDIFRTGNAEEQQAAKEKWAGYHYEVTYEILKKTPSGYEESPNADENIALKTDVISTGNSGTATQTYTLTEDEIKDNVENKTPICRTGQIDLNAEALAGLTGDDLAKLTNYKVKATLRVKDAGAEASASDIVSTTDFFIFTITRLKTDLADIVQ